MNAAAEINTGRANLARGRFFLAKLRETEQPGLFDRFVVETYLMAAIVFGKATQDWMAGRYGGPSKAERKKWLKTTSLWEDPVCELFAKTRNIIVHEDGSVDLLTQHSITVSMAAAIVVLSSPGQEEEAMRLIAEHEEQAVERARHHPPGHRSRVHFKHDNPAIAESPATDVIQGYLDHLERELLAAQVSNQPEAPSS